MHGKAIKQLKIVRLVIIRIFVNPQELTESRPSNMFPTQDEKKWLRKSSHIKRAPITLSHRKLI